MGLAGTKQKQRIPDDPRNTKWANDTNAPGFRLLSSMGWTPTAPGLGNVESQSLIVAGGGSGFSKKISVIPTAKDNTLGIGARKAGAGIGGLSRMGLPVSSMGFVAASAPGAGAAAEENVPKSGGEFGRLLERLNAAKMAAAAADAAEGGGDVLDKKRKHDEVDAAEFAVVESAPVTPLALDSPLAPLSPSASAPASPALTTLLKNPRMAARSKHLRAKRMASSSNAAAMAEILGIAPPSATPPPKISASVLPSSLSSIPFARPSLGTSAPLEIAGPTTDGFPEAPKRAFPMFASASAGTGLQATFEEPVVAVIEPLVETEKEQLRREKRERKDAKRAKKDAAAVPVDAPVVEAPPAVVEAPARKFPMFASSSSVIAATFEAPSPPLVEEPVVDLVQDRKREKKSRKAVAMDVDTPESAAEGGEEVDEAERKRLKKQRKEEKRRKAAEDA